jgi:hypothetical protein
VEMGRGGDSVGADNVGVGARHEGEGGVDYEGTGVRWVRFDCVCGGMGGEW